MKKYTILFGLVIILSFSLSVQGYEETRYFNIDIKDTDRLIMKTGPGKLVVQQNDSLNKIKIEAVISLENVSNREVEEILDNSLELFLERKGNNIYLKSDFGHSNFMNSNFFAFLFSGIKGRYIDLLVELPDIEGIRIDDSSGDIVLEGVSSDLILNDGSGEIELLDCSGDWTIDDNSGNIYIEKFSGKLKIEDGSGRINIANSMADIKIDDNSGDISLKNINGSVDIEDSSGDIWVDNLSQSIGIDDGSGDIILENIGGDVTIWDDSSGDIRLNNISGQVKNYDD